jgi:hypothetical protein
MGAKVIACVSNDKEAEPCKSLGADWTFIHTTEELKTVLKEQTGRKDLDVVFDTLGGDFSEQTFRCLAPWVPSPCYRFYCWYPQSGHKLAIGKKIVGYRCVLECLVTA